MRTLRRLEHWLRWSTHRLELGRLKVDFRWNVYGSWKIGQSLRPEYFLDTEWDITGEAWETALPGFHHGSMYLMGLSIDYYWAER